MASVFWLGILLGRIGLSIGYRGNRQERILLVLSMASSVMLLLTVLSKGLYLSAVLVLLTGIAHSGVYPLIMAIVGQHFRDGVSVGIVATGGGIGAFTFPFAIALFAEQIGLRTAFLFCVGVNAVLAVAAVLILASIKRRPQHA